MLTAENQIFVAYIIVVLSIFIVLALDYFRGRDMDARLTRTGIQLLVVTGLYGLYVLLT